MVHARQGLGGQQCECISYGRHPIAEAVPTQGLTLGELNKLPRLHVRYTQLVEGFEVTPIPRKPTAPRVAAFAAGEVSLPSRPALRHSCKSIAGGGMERGR